MAHASRLLTGAAAALTALAVWALSLPAAHSAPAVGWTGTWASSMQSGGDALEQQTVRQIVHASIGGTLARLHLSNTFGSAALTVQDVHVAQAGSGSATVGGTDHTVTFGG